METAQVWQILNMVTHRCDTYEIITVHVDAVTNFAEYRTRKLNSVRITVLDTMDHIIYCTDYDVRVTSDVPTHVGEKIARLFGATCDDGKYPDPVVRLEEDYYNTLDVEREGDLCGILNARYSLIIRPYKHPINTLLL